MSHSYSQINMHLVFSTKGRKPLLLEKDLRIRTYGYIAGICKKLKSPAVLIGGVEDHIHILCRQARDIATAELIHEIKRSSSLWIKEQPGGPPEFYWQEGYGAFSLSPAHVALVKKYIAEQEEHHRKVTFQDEFRRLCAKYEIELDERYAWD